MFVVAAAIRMDLSWVLFLSSCCAYLMAFYYNCHSIQLGTTLCYLFIYPVGLPHSWGYETLPYQSMVIQ